jgi:hypothetical protein
VRGDYGFKIVLGGERRKKGRKTDRRVDSQADRLIDRQKNE